MQNLFGNSAVAIFDLSNWVARSTAVSGEYYLGNTCRMLLKQRRNLPTHEFVFALEGKGTQRRQALCPTYKAHRQPNPLFLEARQTVIRLLRRTACTLIKAPDGEADDAIASYVHQRCTDQDVLIISNDRDLWQLVSRRVGVQANIKGTTKTIDRHLCARLFGVLPEAIPLAKAVLGDSSDEIPRAIPRLATKKLLRLAAASGDVDRLPQAVKSADYLTPQERKKILDKLAVVKRNQELTKVWDDLDLQVKDCPGSIDEFKTFVAKHDVKLTEAEVKTIVG